MELDLLLQILKKMVLLKILYSKATGDFDDRDSYQWRASFQWEATDDSTLTLIHDAYDEESNRVQISGVFCETGSKFSSRLC